MFIAFEGGEGAGKTEQVRRLADRLRRTGHSVTVTREPGATPLGVEIRDLVLGHQGPMSYQAEALLYLADRAQHAPYIREALGQGEFVLTDRFADSTVAYQGFGRGLDKGVLATVSLWASGGLRPDLTILLDIEPAIGLARIAGRPGAPDRIETEKLDFHRRVRAGFLHLAHDRILSNAYAIVDASQPVDDVAERAHAAVMGWLLEHRNIADVVGA